jgi:hypothetical protein
MRIKDEGTSIVKMLEKLHHEQAWVVLNDSGLQLLLSEWD